ncbi:DEAD/DEAH box helicase, partial [Thermodesulfobacteriota bacterium]
MIKTNKITYPDELPIVAHRDEIIEAIGNNNVVIISGDTGSGKTTQLPKMCLEAGRGQKKMIGCTQPRRIAAVTVASRVAEELGEKFNNLVGHKIRFQNKTTRNTKIKFMTDGILLAETRSDPGLYAYDTLIIDEAHERSLNIDFLIGYVKQLLAKRKEFKVI